MAMQGRVLVIEDDQATLRLFDEVLADSGLAMLGADHERLPPADGFSVVVTDLPGVNRPYASHDAVRWVRQLSDRYAAPIIVLTGRTDAWRDKELRSVVEVMSKPIDIDDFVRRVRAAVTSD